MTIDRLRDLELAGLRTRLMECERALMLWRNVAYLRGYLRGYGPIECRCCIRSDRPSPLLACPDCGGWGVVS